MTPSTCSKCGAVIDPLAHACPYCGLTTPAGVAAHHRQQADAQARAAWDAHAAHAAHAAERPAVEKNAAHALLWSIGGAVLCCIPLGIIGVVMGVRARSAATRIGMPSPLKATLAIVLGIVSLVSTAGLLGWVAVEDSRQQDAARKRIAVLDAATTQRAAAPELAHEVACGLAEVHALRNGFGGKQGHTLSAFECKGALSAAGPGRARLEDFRFRPEHGNDDKPFDVTVCFKRGAAWYVTQLGTGTCEEPAH